MKKHSAKFISLCALLSALGVVMVFLASVLPTGQLGFLALAALFGIAAVIETGIRGGIAVFIVTTLLSFLIVPAKAAAIIYCLLFGWYPVLKSFAEKQTSRIWEWIVKLLAANIGLSILAFAFKSLVFDFLSLRYTLGIIYVAFNVIFVAFDFGVSKAICFYIQKISKRINR